MTPDVLEASRQFTHAAERLPVLWRLGEEFNELLVLLEDEDADQDALEAEMERVVGDIRKKAHGVAAVVRALESVSAYAADESKRMAEKARRHQRHADRLRAYALSCMRAIGVDRLETGTYTLAIRQNPVSVVVNDASAIPAEFNRTRVVVEPDKTAIREHYKATGELVPGTDVVRGERLELR